MLYVAQSKTSASYITVKCNEQLFTLKFLVLPKAILSLYIARWSSVNFLLWSQLSS
jgi:hypothetical protein